MTADLWKLKTSGTKLKLMGENMYINQNLNMYVYIYNVIQILFDCYVFVPIYIYIYINKNRNDPPSNSEVGQNLRLIGDELIVGE